MVSSVTIVIDLSMVISMAVILLFVMLVIMVSFPLIVLPMAIVSNHNFNWMMSIANTSV